MIILFARLKTIICKAPNSSLDKGKLVFGYKQIDANRDVPLCRHDGWLARQSSNKFDSTLAALHHARVKIKIVSTD